MDDHADGAHQAVAAAPQAVRVFVSYAHDDAAHLERVREFWWFLRARGVDARLDRLAGEHRQDWAQWMTREVRDAAYVLVIASPEYKRRADGDARPDEGRGVQWEARQIRNRFHADQDAGLREVLPVVLPGVLGRRHPRVAGPIGSDLLHGDRVHGGRGGEAAAGADQPARRDRTTAGHGARAAAARRTGDCQAGAAEAADGGAG